MIRVAAVGDLHIGVESAQSWRERLAGVNADAERPLTDRGHEILRALRDSLLEVVREIAQLLLVGAKAVQAAQVLGPQPRALGHRLDE